MQNSMMDFVKESLIDADVLLYMISIEEKQIKDEALVARIKKSKIPLFALINKIDTSSQLELETAVQEWSDVFPNQKIIPISALTGFFIPELLQMLIDLLPESPPYFPKDQLSDKPERFFVNESIRKSILEYYDKEIPYAVEVVTESFKEEDKIIRIRAVILVERETQKGIVIGHKGEKLKKVGIGARKDLASFFGKKIHIELFVKVQKNWRSNPQQLKRFGYQQ
jgi:GTP-binding protein Era